MANQNSKGTLDAIETFLKEGKVPFSGPQLTQRRWEQWGYKQNSAFRLALSIDRFMGASKDELCETLMMINAGLDQLRPHEWLEEFSLIRNKAGEGDNWGVQLRIKSVEPDRVGKETIGRERQLIFNLDRNHIPIFKVRKMARYIVEFFLERQKFKDFDGDWMNEGGDKPIRQRAVVHTLARAFMNDLFQVSINTRTIQVKYKTKSFKEGEVMRSANFYPEEEPAEPVKTEKPKPETQSRPEPQSSVPKGETVH